MDGEFKLVIGRAVREMAQFYSSEESFAIKKGRHLPNRGAVIEVLKDLRRVMFQAILEQKILRTQHRNILLVIH